MRVMIATDGSSSAQAAVRWVAALPLPPGSTLLVVPAADVPAVILTDAVAVLGARWRAAALRVPAGDPRLVIPEQADRWQTDLLVVAGSAARPVARTAHGAVLVVKGALRPVRRLLIAVDGSEHALAAARFVAALPLDPATVIELVGVAGAVQCPTPVAVPVFTDVVTERLAERRVTADAALAEAEAIVRGRGFAVDRVVVFGRPGDAIAAAATAGAVDLIVTGARGLGPVKRVLLGSVSERVLHCARCPVLVVRETRPRSKEDGSCE